LPTQTDRFSANILRNSVSNKGLQLKNALFFFQTLAKTVLMCRDVGGLHIELRFFGAMSEKFEGFVAKM